MRWTRFFLPTLREDPKDAESVSHRLMLRAGLVRQLAAGIYSILPLGLLVLRRIEAIVRSEMNRAGAIELSLPALHPAELWKSSGRFETLGEDKFSLKNRSGQQYVLGPTHEEVVTELVAKSVSSYKDLPITLYQIQTKFRDEKRPRYGVIRAKEFLMKDAYSFDKTQEGLEASYRAMLDAYGRIFLALGLQVVVVEADPGMMGGSGSHEFMARVPFGEDIVVSCSSCGESRSREIARRAASRTVQCDPKTPALEAFDTPNLSTIEELEKAFRITAAQMIKTLIYVADGAPVAVLVRGDHEICEPKLKKALGAQALALAEKSEVERATGAPTGFAGPVGLSKIRLLADYDISMVSDGVTGANEKDKHLRHVLPGRDFKLPEAADLRYVLEGDPCASCGGALKLERALEIGHVFKLGTRYSEPFGAAVKDEFGKRAPLLMGCYGIGVSRLIPAVIEQNHDEKGILWPPSIAPFDVELVTLNEQHQPTHKAALGVYEVLTRSGLDVLYDDRDERAGVKFNDADLLGIPVRAVLSEKTVAAGKIELKKRREPEPKLYPLEEALPAIRHALAR